MRIRKAEKKDSSRILEMLNSDSHLQGDKDDKATADDVRQYLSGGTHRIYICEIEKGVAGLIIAEFFRVAKFIYVSHVIIDEKWRKMGIATKLMRNVERIARKENYDLIEMFVKQGNGKMKKFMKKLNYGLGDKFLFYSKEIR
jgi:ribosomal protein S18 acetylase RimI-like enzyme